MLIALSALEGYAVEASDGGRIGTIRDVLFDDVTWRIRWLVVDVGSWLAERKALIHPSAIRTPDYDQDTLRVTLTKAQVEDSPPIFADQPVSATMESSFYDYYGSEPLWGSGSFAADALAAPVSSPGYGSAGATSALSDGESARNEGEPNLRSSAEVAGYHMHATDGEIGHAENFLVDDGSWVIRYIIVDTTNWWPGKHVLIAPHAVRSISWADREIRLGVDRDLVKASPPWDPVVMIDQVYEKQLHTHYDWPGYAF